MLSCCRASQALQTSRQSRLPSRSSERLQRAGDAAIKSPRDCCSSCGPWEQQPQQFPFPFLELGLTQALHLSQHDLNSHISAPCWAKRCLALSAPVPSTAKRSSSSAPALQIRLTFSTEFVFTLKYPPLALNLSHSGRDHTRRLNSSLTRTHCSYSFIIKSAKQTIAI